MDENAVPTLLKLLGWAALTYVAVMIELYVFVTGIALFMIGILDPKMVSGALFLGVGCMLFSTVTSFFYGRWSLRLFFGVKS